MFNMGDVGIRLSELRKSRNMTQLELADRMGISFQAVSNWERGASMPDIAKLPELAELFGVSIDEILGERSRLVESAAAGDLEELIKDTPVIAEELCAAAPLLKPEQVDAVFEKLEVKDLREVGELLPFIGREQTERLARQAVEGGSYEGLDELAPYLGEAVRDELARRLIAEGRSIEPLAPFISREILSELAETGYREGGLRAIEDVAPFLPQSKLQSLACEEYEARGLRHFDAIAPFLDKDYLSALAKQAVERDGIKALSPIIPFLDKKLLSEYIKEKFL